jgi:hypothetical protein
MYRSSSVSDIPAAELRRREASLRAVARGRLEEVIEPGSESAVKTVFGAVLGVAGLLVVHGTDCQEAQQRLYAKATGQGAALTADLHR